MAHIDSNRTGAGFMSNEAKQHPHAKLIAQLARDALKTDRPQDWYEVQHGIEWQCYLHTDGLPVFNKNFKYRRRPQWEIDGLKVGDKVVCFDGEIVEIKSFEQISGNYEEFLINERFSSKIFKKYEPPRTVNINGFEVPEPMREIQSQQPFYYPCFDGRVCRAQFSVMNDKHAYLRNMGLCHATYEAAELLSKALASLKIKGGV